MLKAGQNLLLNGRLWYLRQVQPGQGRTWALEAIGVSAAALGLSRPMSAVEYGAHVFIQPHPRDFYQADMQHDWLDTERGPALNCRSATWLDLLAVHTRTPAKGDTKNEFSWSYSRAAKYRQCPRAYYYHYYAAWEGWQAEAPAPVRRAYLLKNLTDLSLWVGTLVHDSIKFALARLKAGRPITAAEVVKRMHARAQADIENSYSGRYRQKSNQLTGFQEHYYQTNLPAAVWQTTQAQAELHLHTFFNSTLYAGLQGVPAPALLKVEELQSFTLAGTKIWVQMDLAQPAGDKIFVYDWKTGPIELTALRQQLGIYGLYLRQSWWSDKQVQPALQAVVYALAEDRVLTFDLDEALLQETQAQVETNVAQLRGLLLDPETNLAELRRFPMISDLNVCRRCQFRELCGRG